jgi:uncharacterized protein (DUF488 family)
VDQIWTIGHWTLAPEDFVALPTARGVDLVADVRAHPGSRSSPHFPGDILPGWLAADGIGYAHLAALGGRRRRQDVDPRTNAGWQNTSFKNYADHTLLPEYEDGIRELTALAADRRVAVMCAEPMPWRCHRLLVANTLVARGWQVLHVVGPGEPPVHELGAWGARPHLDGAGVVTYPPDEPPRA